MNITELRMALRPLAFLDAHADDPDGLLRLRTSPAPRFQVWHEEAVEQVFRTDRLLTHPASNTLGPLLGSRSLLWTDGPRHRHYRRLIGPALHGTHLAGYRSVIADVARDAVAALPSGTRFGLADWTRRLTLRIIGRILFGDPDDALLTAFADWIDKALAVRPRTLVYRYVAHRLPHSGTDFDHALLAAARRAPDTSIAGRLAAGGTDDGELRDQIVSLLFAGHETTASAMAWTLYFLAACGLDDDVAAELRAVDGGADADRVPLLQAVIKEALRLRPPAPVAGKRALTVDGELRGRPLPAGTVLVPSIYLAHHRSAAFPDPHRFDPGRFLGTEQPVTPHYFPFGGGTRYCLGSELATLEIRMVTAAVLRRGKLRCVNPDAAVPRFRGPAMAPSRRLRTVVTP
ncbi:MAG TPA: cytochrome P450 [Pseudonocardiaceae bacterium]|nr:cytochrome P450 [Pseudonocardiaceae bacterium]